MQKNQFTALLYGWITVFGLIMIASFILALLLRFTSFNEPALSWVTLIIGLLSLFIGGMAAGIKGKAKGWIIGAITGTGFTLFIFLVQYLGYQQGFSLEQMLHHVAYIAAALFGGAVGVNIVGPQVTES
ncbi:MULTISPECIES: TIGR04086 family membrane protein [Virgibacillus]|uniref:TIGR04086 family membrane protein n=2 Tax=Virgibacillus TaxID=84406 RepID=A0ABQ2DAL4_9BACI|nr:MULTISPECIES: TIGR04086 family membrane protein [Virgibacillus]EQB35848.1 hypothetical protein M948_12475 [Virgibacillus sp. CM-4]MYL41651.1 TIGR04086 family membrane protein [Virgibacillus massiliensis]GGJ49170.1 hypothetical protein GCM10007111_09110 [Virgibacillus kapii]CDQ39460.1 putative membrane protein [Virgibacillus massiliensis]